MKNTGKKIGTVRMIYGISGKLLSGIFTPVLEVEVPFNVKRQMKKVESTEDPEVLKHNADLVFSAWFSELNSVELADPEKFKIESEIVKCDKWPDGKVKECVLAYFQKEMSTAQQN